MGKKQTNKNERIAKKVYDYLVELSATRGALDYTATRDRLKHKKGIDSGTKFDTAIAELVESGKITVDKKTITVSTNTPEKGTITPLGEKSNIVYGRVIKVSHDNLVFVPNDKKAVDGEIMILTDKKLLPKYENKLCSIELLPSRGLDKQPCGLLKDILGEAGSIVPEFDTIAWGSGCVNFSDPVVQKELEKIPTEVDLTAFNLATEDGVIITNNGKTETVVDLRHLPFTTTDPATCKDMDDAIYSTYDNNGNIIVYTAVADVTRYVDLNSEIGKRYIRGGFTFYAPNRAYNILPTELSTGICSLNPNVPRMAFVVKTTIDKSTGKPINSTFMNAVIESKEKFSYEQAQAIVDENPNITKMYLLDKTKAGVSLTREELVVMNKYASDLISKGFSSRNQIKFGSRSEYDPVFSEDGTKIIDMVPEDDSEYHKVIESFMITANEASAKFALEHNIPIIYRVHDEPNDSKIEQAYEFFGYLGIPFDGDLTPSGTKAILESVKGTSKESAVSNFLVRMQSKAKYSITTDPKADMLTSNSPRRSGSRHQNDHFVSGKLAQLNRVARNQALGELIEHIKEEEKLISHFGLQSLHYSHTTSPIRRITDYVTHYNIKAYLNHTEMLPISIVKEIAQWANERQDAIDQAERELAEFNSALYCESHINEVLKGRICGFKSLVDGKISGAKDIMVIVESPEKGIKVQIPAIEILGEGALGKNIGISQFSSAIVNKQTGAGLLRLCEDVTFKIAEADRITRTAYASTNIAKDFTQTNFLQEQYELEQISPIASNVTNPIHLRNLAESKRKKEEAEKQKTKHKSSRKIIKDSTKLASDVTDLVDEEEAEHFKKKSSQAYRSYKQQLADAKHGEYYSDDEYYNNGDYYDESENDDDDLPE